MNNGIWILLVILIASLAYMKYVNYDNGVSKYVLYAILIVLLYALWQASKDMENFILHPKPYCPDPKRNPIVLEVGSVKLRRGVSDLGQQDFVGIDLGPGLWFNP